MARQIELSVMSFSFASDRILSKIDKILTSFLSSELLDLLLLFIVFCAIINPSSKLLDNSLISPERRGKIIRLLFLFVVGVVIGQLINNQIT